MTDPDDLRSRRSRPAKYRYAVGVLFAAFAVAVWTRSSGELTDVDRMAIFGFSLLSVFQFVRGWLQSRGKRERND